jgi:dephospho-CoA kinase
MLADAWYNSCMKLIVALTGEKLGGKDTVAQYLVDRYGAFHVRHSHILDDILKILDMPISRRNEIDMGMSLRRVFGEGTLNPALRKRVSESDANLIVINGYRFQDELANVKSLGAHTVYITAPEEVRYQRFLQRQEKADDARQTIEQFRQQEHEPTEVGIPALGAQADFKIENTGTLEELYKKIDNIIDKIEQNRRN